MKRGQRKERPPYEPFGGCKELLLSQDMEALIAGPAGTGKSLAALFKLHLACEMVPETRCLMVRKTRASLTESALVTFEKHVLPPGHSSLRQIQRRLRTNYVYPNGSEIVVGGMDNDVKIMSTDYDLIYIQEAIELSLANWEALSSRLRTGKMGYRQLFGDTNPDKPSHWLKQRCDRGLTHLIESRHEDNPTLWDHRKREWTLFARTPEGTGYLDRLDRLTGMRLKRLRYGQWVQAEGQIYEAWDKTVHVVPPRVIPEDWPRYLAIDFGYTSPFCCLFVARDGDGRLYIYRQIYQTGTLVEDLAREIVRLMTNEPKPSLVLCDHDAEGRATLEKYLNVGTTAACKTRDKKKAGIQYVQDRLRAAGDGKPRLFVVEGSLVRCDSALREKGAPTCAEEEFEGYVWKISENQKAGEEPIDKDDHAMDALRYLVYDLDSPGPEWNIYHLRLDKKPDEDSTVAHPVKFPQIRWFAPSGGYQPWPQLPNGEQFGGADCFQTQSQAAYFVALFYEKMGFAVPETLAGTQLTEEEKKGVAEKLDKFLRDRRLPPPKKEEPQPKPAQPQEQRKEKREPVAAGKN